MARVEMEELVQVQTIGPKGRGMYPPVSTEEVDSRSAAGLEMKKIKKGANILPNPGAVDNGAVMTEKNDEWVGVKGGGGGGSDYIPLPESPSQGDFLVYDGDKWDAQTISVWQGGEY